MMSGLSFDRREVAGAFGDTGTTLPLLVTMIVVLRLDPASVCIVFGALQVTLGLRYRLPIAVQPLKAMAAIAISSRVSPGTLAAGGLVCGALMLLLSASRALS